MATATGLIKELQRQGKARHGPGAARFFKTGKGEYSEQDLFLGVRMPALRLLAKDHTVLSLVQTETLLASEFHEARLLALLILVNKFNAGDNREKNRVARSYLRNCGHVNNWDLVDCSAHLILGPWLEHRDRKKLDVLARSSSLWERRMAMIATLHFIRKGDFDDALRIAAILVDDGEDLIHKAVGWMLREIGNRNKEVEEIFLQKHYHTMPRTMLRYAIEKFPETRRQAYLKGMI